MTSEPTTVAPTAATREAAHRVLEARARQLARPVREPGERPADALLVFRLGGGSYALPTDIVREVFPLLELARLPGATPPLFGVTAWRGDLLTLVDLRQALGSGARPLQDLNRVVVLEGPTGVFGILVDAVEEMRSVEAASVQPLPRGEDRDSLLRGVTPDGLLVLDPDVLLNTHG